MEVDNKYEAVIKILESNQEAIEFYMKKTGKTLPQVVKDSLAIYGKCIDVANPTHKKVDIRGLGNDAVLPGCVYIVGANEDSGTSYYDDLQILKKRSFFVGRA